MCPVEAAAQGPALQMVAVAVAQWLGGVGPPTWAPGTCLPCRERRWELVEVCGGCFREQNLQVSHLGRN